ncbi:unnamed protein product [Heterobilharzia americana]|nr:unnamed protein product [Heterobilharzia americana]
MFSIIIIVLLTVIEITASTYHTKVAVKLSNNDNSVLCNQTVTCKASTLYHSVLVCDKCQAAVKYIQSVLLEDFEVKKIDNWIETLCKVTGGYNITCSALLAQYVDNAIQMINSTNPITPCQTIKLCK